MCLNHHGGYRNTATFVLTGPDIEAKARFAEASLLDATGGPSRFGTYDLRTEPTATGARLTLTVKDPDRDKVGRSLFGAVVGTGLSSAPGLHMEHFSPKPAEYGVHWPALLPAALVHPEVVLHDGTRIPVPRPPAASVRLPARPPAPSAPLAQGPTVRAPLGLLVGARSGDKGGDANVGLWARDDAAYGWLRDWLDVERLRALLPEAAELAVSRYELPNLRALNFVLHGLLGEGVAASTRPDPQAKGLGEHLRGLRVDVPAALVPAQRREV